MPQDDLHHARVRDAAGPASEFGAAASDAAASGASESLVAPPADDDWATLADLTEPATFARAWLQLLRLSLPAVEQALVVFSDSAQPPFDPVATWPNDALLRPELMAVAELALAQQRGAVRARLASDGRERTALAWPLSVDGRCYGVAAVDGPRPAEADLSARMRALQWGGGWFEVLVRRQAAQRHARLGTLLELTAAAVGSARFHAAATAVATELASALDCERVAIGLLRGQRVRLCALSHSAEFDRKSGLSRDLAAAMEEAIDQQDQIVFPEPPDQPPLLVRAHAELLERQRSDVVVTLPFTDGERPTGALTLERAGARDGARAGSAGFSPAELDLCAQVAALIGPLLVSKRREDRWIGFKVIDAIGGSLAAVFGRGRLGLKLGVIGALALIAFLALAQGEYRVRAPASLEGVIQRAVAAPIDGYVASAEVRAGDLVAAGDLLFAMEDRDLRVERQRLDSERVKLEREYSQALAAGDRPGVRVLGARIAQAEARLALVDEQLARIRVTAPFAGIVVTGDLSQALGAPVSRGDVLFEVAPLDAYRVRLRVDERDIQAVAIGQAGQLALSGLPGQTLPIRVTRITPVSRVEGGRNLFIVEAALEETPAVLRPGMEGIGKIAIDRRRLAWIWTHRLVQWLRLQAWVWLS